MLITALSKDNTRCVITIVSEGATVQLLHKFHKIYVVSFIEQLAPIAPVGCRCGAHKPILTCIRNSSSVVQGFLFVVSLAEILSPVPISLLSHSLFSFFFRFYLGDTWTSESSSCTKTHVSSVLLN